MNLFREDIELIIRMLYIAFLFVVGSVLVFLGMFFQWSKIQEETNEVLDAIDKNDLNQKKLEIADVFIAVSGLIRFDITAFFNKIDILFL